MAARADIPPLLARRRRWRIAAGLVVAVLVAISVLDHAGVFGYPGNDLRTLDGASVAVVRVVDGDTITVRPERGGREFTVRLLGVDAPDLPDAHWAVQARAYTSNRLLNRTVTLKLDPLAAREPATGDVLAYAYVTVGDNLNLDIVHDGQAYADRRVKHTFHVQFESAETEARRKKRGLWKTLWDDQMPEWRKQWLRERIPGNEPLMRTKKPSH